MGNHHSHKSHNGSGNSTPNSTESSLKNNIVRRLSSSSSNSNKDSNKNGDSQASNNVSNNLLPAVEKLAKILHDKSQEEEGVNGITFNVFTKYLFPRYPILSEKLFAYFRRLSKSKDSYINTSAFKQQCEKYLGMLDDSAILNHLTRMFSLPPDDPPDDCADDDYPSEMTPELLTSMLMCGYHVSMDHYSGGPQMCLHVSRTLKALVQACFHGKEVLSAQYVAHWLEANCPRLLMPLNRYVVHTLATSWRSLEGDGPQLAQGLELTTPVLEQLPPFGSDGKPRHRYMLNMSMSWLLAGALPALYSRPQRAHSPSNSGTGLASSAFLTKLLCAVPSHWQPLYESNEMGLGANRFLHHVLGYKGPTLVLLRTGTGGGSDEEAQVFCVAAPCEWKESHLYWGGEEGAVYQLLPRFQVLELGSKMLYLNLSVRGYPQGLRAGKDPRNPVIIVDAGFEKIEFRKIPYPLDCIEVWGCGDQVSRETQLEIKKWEVKEAERQRCVKISASDWVDHPDRYLLELAGRPQYHHDQNQPS